MFCPVCGTQIEDGTVFCPGCGNRIEGVMGGESSPMRGPRPRLSESQVTPDLGKLLRVALVVNVIVVAMAIISFFGSGIDALSVLGAIAAACAAVFDYLAMQGRMEKALPIASIAYPGLSLLVDLGILFGGQYWLYGGLGAIILAMLVDLATFVPDVLVFLRTKYLLK